MLTVTHNLGAMVLPLKRVNSTVNRIIYRARGRRECLLVISCFNVWQCNAPAAAIGSSTMRSIRCGLLLPLHGDLRWSTCPCVCLSVRHDRYSSENGWADRRCRLWREVWETDKGPSIKWEPGPPMGRCTFAGHTWACPSAVDVFNIIPSTCALLGAFTAYQLQFANCSLCAVNAPVEEHVFRTRVQFSSCNVNRPLAHLLAGNHNLYGCMRFSECSLDTMCNSYENTEIAVTKIFRTCHPAEVTFSLLSQAH